MTLFEEHCSLESFLIYPPNLLPKSFSDFKNKSLSPTMHTRDSRLALRDIFWRISSEPNPKLTSSSCNIGDPERGSTSGNFRTTFSSFSTGLGKFLGSDQGGVSMMEFKSATNQY